MKLKRYSYWVFLPYCSTAKFLTIRSHSPFNLIAQIYKCRLTILWMRWMCEDAVVDTLYVLCVEIRWQSIGIEWLNEIPASKMTAQIIVYLEHFLEKWLAQESFCCVFDRYHKVQYGARAYECCTMLLALPNQLSSSRIFDKLLLYERALIVQYMHKKYSLFYAFWNFQQRRILFLWVLAIKSLFRDGVPLRCMQDTGIPTSAPPRAQ